MRVANTPYQYCILRIGRAWYDENECCASSTMVLLHRVVMECCRIEIIFLAFCLRRPSLHPGILTSDRDASSWFVWYVHVAQWKQRDARSCAMPCLRVSEHSNRHHILVGMLALAFQNSIALMRLLATVTISATRMQSLLISLLPIIDQSQIVVLDRPDRCDIALLHRPSLDLQPHAAA